MIDNITIKSGIDITSDEFKNYYDSLKKEEINFSFLDMAVSNNSKVLSDPIIFNEKDYSDYKIDDISFIISNSNIIGHMVYSLEKKKATIPLSLGTKNHLDLKRVKELSGRLSFNRLEYFCKYNIDINDLIIKYLSSRTNGDLEYRGNITIENKIRIKK